MDCKGHIDLRPGCTECHLDAAIARAEKAEKERDEVREKYLKVLSVDHHLEAHIKKLREALEKVMAIASGLDEFNDGDVGTHVHVLARTALRETDTAPSTCEGDPWCIPDHAGYIRCDHCREARKETQP